MRELYGKYCNAMETNTFVLKCPHCGAKKEVGFSTDTWINVEYKFWSDSRIESSRWYNPAYTQQCPACGKFFTLPRRDSLKVNEKECFETGFLPLQTLKQAIVELAGDDIAEPRARLEAWWAFNAKYKDTNNIPADELAYYRANMQWLVEFHTLRATRFSHLLFELHRLLGHRDVCEKMIKSLTYDVFVRQRKRYYKENNIKFYNDEKLLKLRYETEMKALNYALTLPLKPYIKSVE